MGFFSSILAPRHNVAFNESFWSDLFSGLGVMSKSGRSVNVKTSLEVMAVLACVRVLSEGVAQVPLKLFKERDDGGSDVAKKHQLYRLLYRKPNPWQTSFEFRETMVIHAALAGRFIAFKNVVRGQVKELIPFEPGEVQVRRNNDRSLTYLATAQDGAEQEFPASSIWHVKGPSWNGWDGMETIKLAREAIGLAMATEESHARFHANGAQTSGVYSVDGTLTDAQYGMLRRWIESHIAGENKFKPLILDRNGKWTSTGMNGVDSQHLETRKFQIEEICRAFRVMPIMIGLSDKTATYASAEQMFLAHVVHTLMPWYERIEQSIDANLLTEKDIEEGIYAKFLPNALMRGAAKDRAEFYYRLWQMGALNANEIRAYEEQNPYDGGEVYRVPVNFQATDAAEDGIEAGSDDQAADPLAPPRRSPMNAGRVLSARNEKRIRDADGLLQECLSELDKEEENAKTNS